MRIWLDDERPLPAGYDRQVTIRVGIFWWVAGELVGDAVPLDQAEPYGESLRQFERVAGLPGIVRVAGFPDLHPDKGGPVGAAMLSAGEFYPYLIGSDGLGELLLRSHIEKYRDGGLCAEDDETWEYLTRHDHCIRWTIANRELIAHRLLEQLSSGYSTQNPEELSSP